MNKIQQNIFLTFKYHLTIVLNFLKMAKILLKYLNKYIELCILYMFNIKIQLNVQLTTHIKILQI